MSARRWLSLLALLTLLAACNVNRLAQRFADHVMSPADKALVTGFFSDVRADHLDAARQRFAPNHPPGARDLGHLHALMTRYGDPRLYGVHADKQSGQPWRLGLSYRIGHEHERYLVMLRIGGPAGQRRLVGLMVARSLDLVPEIRTALIWTGAFAALIAALVVVVLVRRRRPSSR